MGCWRGGSCAGTDTSYIGAGVADHRWLQRLLVLLSIVGYVVCFSCLTCAHGVHLPDIDAEGGANPLLEVVWPEMRDGKLSRNLGNVLLYGGWEGPLSENWLSLVPLVELHALTVAALFWWARSEDRKQAAEQTTIVKGETEDTLPKAD